MKTELITSNEDLLVFTSELLEVQILGGIKYTQLDALRVTLKVSRKDFRSVRHSLNLYNQKAIENLLQILCDRFQLEAQEIDYVLSELLEKLEAFRLEKLNFFSQPEKQAKVLNEKELKDARAYLSSDDLMERTGVDIGKSGIVGEDINRLLMYLIFTSRKHKNLNVITISESGVGKTHLMESVGALIPEEDKIEFTSMTNNSLYYFRGEDLDKKLLLIEDYAGCSDEALYSLRELQSKGQLNKIVTSKDAKGHTRSQQVQLQARVSVAGCSTRNIITDNLSRAIILNIDGSKEQDERIMSYQRKVSGGLINKKEEQKIQELFKNCQRILKPVTVHNPYAKDLLLPATIYNPRRLMQIYLDLISNITFYHQYQREVVDNTIKVTLEDIKWANKLLFTAILRKSDELQNSTRELYEKIKVYLTTHEKKSFTSKEIRFSLRIPNSTLTKYMKELIDGQYIRIKSGNRYKGFTYQVTDENEFKQLRETIENTMNEQLSFLESVTK